MSNRLIPRWTSLLAFAALPMLAAPADQFRISGPYVHENLSIFLIHAKSGQASGNFLTLQEAMEKTLPEDKVKSLKPPTAAKTE